MSNKASGGDAETASTGSEPVFRYSLADLIRAERRGDTLPGYAWRKKGLYDYKTTLSSVVEDAAINLDRP